MYYADLPEEFQKRFLGYRFHVYVLENISDAEVLGLFARMNTYSFKLTAQELRNAEFFGAFKQAVYRTGLKYLTFWHKNILKDQQIARMLEAEIVSELIICMMDGIKQTKAADLREYYLKYDDSFPQEKKIVKQFDEVINTFGEIFGESLGKSNFRRIPLFYSLFLVIYDAKFGLPGSEYPRVVLTAEKNKILASELRKLNEVFALKKPAPRFVQFIDASKLSTADVGKRKLRHKFLWHEVFSKIS